jgi:hypothetical protein
MKDKARATLRSQEVVVYVPAQGSRVVDDIARGSAIVGRSDLRRRYVRIYFEGAIYKENLGPFVARVRSAYGRLAVGYPTRGTRVVVREALVAVGTFDADRGTVALTGPESERELLRWLGKEHLAPRSSGFELAGAPCHPDVEEA